MSSTKRRLIFAAPFVVTALGCSHPPPKQPVPDTTPVTSPDARPGDADAAPVANEDDIPPAPEGEGRWTKPDDRWVWTYTGGSSTITFYVESGTCFQEFGPPDMPEDSPPVVTYWNPPPPRTVECPPGLPAEAKQKP
jgi:hypothetical protein